jgi:hypothetical protein
MNLKLLIFFFAIMPGIVMAQNCTLENVTFNNLNADQAGVITKTGGNCIVPEGTITARFFSPIQDTSMCIMNAEVVNESPYNFGLFTMNLEAYDTNDIKIFEDTADISSLRPGTTKSVEAVRFFDIRCNEIATIKLSWGQYLHTAGELYSRWSEDDLQKVSSMTHINWLSNIKLELMDGLKL